MLTRLKVNGFKNLADIDVRFGPFTCVAGANGVGKSNLFDAIAFLSALADKPLIEAAQAIRGGDGRRGDVRSLFRRVGDDIVDRMTFLAEMIIPSRGEDVLGQPAEAGMTFLRYELSLRYRTDEVVPSMGQLEVERESMVHINRTSARSHLGFRHSKAWRDSVILGRRTSPYISTEGEGESAIVSLHADNAGARGGGKPRRVPASGLPRTVLSSVNNAAEHRTLVLARQEMMSWTQLQLEPSALRASDNLITSPRSIGPNGAHLPATLHALAQAAERQRTGGGQDVYTQIANRLSQLIEGVRSITVDVDEKRDLLTIIMTDRMGTEHVAGALSDGTLRFLALTVMEADPYSRRLLCLEEPENGMHPSRIPEVLSLLEDLCVDLDFAVDQDNPLRQAIINTHSPSVVTCIDSEDLLVADLIHGTQDRQEFARLSILPTPESWRAKLAQSSPTVARGRLLAYLNPFGYLERGGIRLPAKNQQAALLALHDRNV